MDFITCLNFYVGFFLHVITAIDISLIKRVLYFPLLKQGYASGETSIDHTQLNPIV